MRCGDDDRVHGLRANQLQRIAKNLHALRVVTFKLVRRGAANSGEFASADFAGEQIPGVMFADVAHADDANAHFVHAAKFSPELFSAQPKLRSQSRGLLVSASQFCRQFWLLLAVRAFSKFAVN